MSSSPFFFLRLGGSGSLNAMIYIRGDRADYDGSYLEPALKRFRMMLQLPIIPVEKISSMAVAAVESDRRYVRLPRRAAMYHMLNNAPRRVVELGLVGVKLRRPAAARS